MYLYSKKNLLSLILFLLFTPFFIEALIIEPPTDQPLFKDFMKEFMKIITIATLVFAPLIILIGAIYFVSSGGDPQRITKVKKIILFTFIALIIILLIRGLPSAIRYLLTGER